MTIASLLLCLLVVAIMGAHSSEISDSQSPGSNHDPTCNLDDRWRPVGAAGQPARTGNATNPEGAEATGTCRADGELVKAVSSGHAFSTNRASDAGRLVKAAWDAAETLHMAQQAQRGCRTSGL